METKQISSYQSPITRIIEKFSRHRDVNLVYGESIEFENKKVLPVAKVKYMGGGGGGYSDGTGTSTKIQGEGGGGGYVSITPIGVYEIDSKRVKFKPVVDVKFALPLFTLATFGIVYLIKKLMLIGKKLCASQN